MKSVTQRLIQGLLLSLSSCLIHGGSLAQFHLPLGDVLVELYDQDKPVTVSNFLKYITSGRYQDSFVHRWEPGFVIQGGGFAVTNLATGPAVVEVPTFGRITNEYSVGATLRNLYGTVAMARVGGETNSATSQWFFNLSDENVFLDGVDGGFTVFGRTLLGTNVLNRFNNTSITNGLYRVNAGGALNHLPVLSTNVTFDDLVYTVMSTQAWPKVQITLQANGSRLLQWNSLSNFVQVVESRDLGLITWTPLAEIPGTGALMSHADLVPLTQGRFYRIRIRE
jgi:cyclophilin family peptidyl-prolyl cis-trans isomerase